MRILLKKCWLNAGQMMKTIMSFLAVFFFSSRKVAKKIETVAFSTDKSKKAFVLGNGPSLKEILRNSNLLQEIKDGVAIVTNRFAVSGDFYELKPQYYILMDPLFYDEKAIIEDSSIKEMYDSLNLVDWSMILFLSKGANLEVVKKHLNNKMIKVLSYNATTILGPSSIQNLLYRKNLGIPSSRNIIIPAIMLMINLGYKDVILYGAEFSWTKNIDVNPINNKVFLNNGHFYKDEDIVYYGKGWYKWYLAAVVEMLSGTEQLQKYANYKRVKVINRTKGSFIDAFEYENPDNIKYVL